MEGDGSDSLVSRGEGWLPPVVMAAPRGPWERGGSYPSAPGGVKAAVRWPCFLFAFPGPGSADQGAPSLPLRGSGAGSPVPGRGRRSDAVVVHLSTSGSLMGFRFVELIRFRE